MKSSTNWGVAVLGLFALTTMTTRVEAGEFKVYWKDGIRMDTEDQSVRIKFGGRIQSDWSIVSEDDATRELLGDQAGGHEFRRARLYFSGELYKSVIFKFQYDFSDESFKDMFIGLETRAGTFKVGHFKELTGLEQLTSSKYITFMERSLPSVFDEARNSGFGWGNAFGEDDRYTLNAAVFKNSDGKGEATITDNWAFGTRVTALPIYDEKGVKLLHVGGWFRTSDPGGESVRFRQRPELHLTDRYVNTDHIEGIDAANAYGFEGAMVMGPLSFQGEWKGVSLDAPDAMDPSFSSWYIYGTYFLTGEHRRYKNVAGAFSRTKPSNPVGPDGGAGAWEVGARYSWIDLNDEEITGGKLQDFTIALNWYLNNNTRMMFNYIHADLEDVGKTNGFSYRFQIDF